MIRKKHFVCLFLAINSLIIQAQTDDALIAPPGTVVVNNGNSHDYGAQNDAGQAPTAMLPLMSGYYVTVAEATAQYVMIKWRLPSDSLAVRVIIRRNNMWQATHILPAGSTQLTATGLSFVADDVLQIKVTTGDVSMQCSATYVENLRDAARANIPNSQPLATVEAIHPRRGRQRETGLAVAAPRTCVWLRNADLNDRLYYKMSLVEPCIGIDEPDSLLFYTCLSANTAFFSFDNAVFLCQNSGGDNTEGNLRTRALSSSVAPNPFTSFFEVTTTTETPFVRTQIQVYNALGQCIYSNIAENETAAQRFIIPLENEPQGMYFYTIWGDKTLVAQGRVLKTN